MRKDSGTTTSPTPGNLTTGDQSGASVADVLKKARALIEKRDDWCQGVEVGFGGNLPTCAALALSVAAPGNTALYHRARNKLANAIGDDDIIDWNDAPERTHAEVLAAFDRAIELATNAEPGSPAVNPPSNAEGVVP